MNSIIYDDKIITPKDNKYNYYYNFTNKLNKKNCVKFALFCAKIVNNNNNKESNDCIELVEKWLIDKNSVTLQELHDASNAAYAFHSTYASYAVYASVAVSAANAAYYSAYYSASAYAVANANASSNASVDNINLINKYLQILLRKTKQFQNNQVLEQISKTDVDKLELVDWNMITDIMQEEYNIVHEFNYEDIFSRRCLIELLRGEYL